MNPPETEPILNQPQMSSFSSFALLALNGSSRIRALHFPPDTYSRLTVCIKRSWPEGIEWATLQSGQGWDCLLKGTPWKKKGSEELESIRLILGILDTLSQDGWHLLQEVQVGASKTAVHHFVFRHNGNSVSSKTDRFFAVTFPLPDRISLVDPPIAHTPAIISAIRSAISNPDLSPEELQQSPITIQTELNIKSGFRPDEGISEQGLHRTGSSSYRSGQQSPRKARSRHHHIETRTFTEGSIRIKDEAWVGTGVYGFELGGLSVFAGKGTSDFKYDSRQPTLLVALLANLHQQQWHLVTSVRLVPTNARRDVLIFRHTTFEDDLDNAVELILPPRLSFPSADDSPTSPGLSFETSGPKKASRRNLRVRPSSLASLNGAPLLPSIPASPSTPWGDAAPSSHRLNVPSVTMDNPNGDFLLDRSEVETFPDASKALSPGPATADPRIESHTIPPQPSVIPSTTGQRRHKKSLSMPAKVANAWRILPPARFHQIPPTKASTRPKHLNDPVGKTDGDASDFRATSLPTWPRSPTSPTFVSNGPIKVKEPTAEPQPPIMANVRNSHAIRDSQRPEVGIIHSQFFIRRKSGSDSEDKSADSSVNEKARTRSASGDGAKLFPRPRRSIRGFFKALR